ncbi:MAG: MFS transporter [Pirellulales bacterium]
MSVTAADSSTAEKQIGGLSLPVAWTTIAIAAAAMVATLPGRTFGLGLVERQMSTELGLTELDVGHINLWATLIGALACFPAGRLIDQFGLRAVLFGTALGLGLVVRGLASIHSTQLLFVFILLTRAFGQSAMSVVSIAIVGKSFDRRKSWPMAAFSVLMTIGFMTAFGVVGPAVKDFGWRYAWSGVGIAVLCLAPFAWLLPKRLPTFAAEDHEATVGHGFTLRQALATPAFWMFAAATSLFGLVASGLTLFNAHVLAERGLSYEDYYETAKAAAPFGLIGQGICGGLARIWSYQRITTLGACLYAVGVACLTLVTTRQELLAASMVSGLGGGMLTVVFFAAFPRLFGRRELGRIQGFAQLLTVLASAVGPLAFAVSKEYGGSFTPVLYVLSATVVVVGLAALLVPSPKLPDDAMKSVAVN